MIRWHGRNNFWFGTVERMQWIRTPRQGAPANPEGWNAGGTLLNGGGWKRQSISTHKTYVFEWSDASPVQEAQLMKDYRDGIHGTGPLYFLDPLNYTTNCFSARWAAPAMMCHDESATMVYGLTPDEVPTSSANVNRLPLKSAYYDLTGVSAGYRGDAESFFLPIPTGFTLYLGAFYTATDDGGVFANTVSGGVTSGTVNTLTPIANNASTIVADTFSGVDGVRVWLGKTGADGSVIVSGLVARYYRTGETPSPLFFSGPWVGGSGHSGVRFDGEPTYVENTGIDGGRAGYAASFKETADWE